MAPGESPVLFGHTFVKEQPTPACPDRSGSRDFVSTMTKQRDSGVDCRPDENSQTSTPWDGSTDLPRQQPEDRNPVTSTPTSGCPDRSRSRDSGQVSSEAEETETEDR